MFACISAVLYYWVAFCWMNAARLAYSFTGWWRCRLVSGYKAARNIQVQTSCGHVFLFLLGKYPERNSGSYEKYMLRSIRNDQNVFQSGVPFRIPTSNGWKFPLHCFLPNMSIFFISVIVVRGRRKLLLASLNFNFLPPPQGNPSLIAGLPVKQESW